MFEEKLKAGRIEGDIRTLQSQGCILSGNSIVSPQQQSQYMSGLGASDGDDLYYISGQEHPNYTDGRRVNVIPLEGEILWDGSTATDNHFLVEGLYRATDSSINEYHITDRRLIARKAHYTWSYGLYSIDYGAYGYYVYGQYIGKKHNVSFRVQIPTDQPAATLTLQYAFYNSIMTYGGGEFYIIGPGYDTALTNTHWTTCETKSCDKEAYLTSGEITVPDNIPPVVVFRILTSNTNSTQLVKIEQVISRNAPLSHYCDFFEVNQNQKPANAFIFKSVYGKNLPTGFEQTGANYTAGRIQKSNGINLVSTINETNAQFPVNSPKEIATTLTGFSSNERPVYTRLYIPDIGFRDYQGVSKPGFRLYPPQMYEFYNDFIGTEYGLIDSERIRVFRGFYSNAKKITFWIRGDGQTNSTFDFILARCDDLENRPNFHISLKHLGDATYKNLVLGQYINEPDGLTYGVPLTEFTSKATYLNQTTINSNVGWQKIEVNISEDDTTRKGQAFYYLAISYQVVEEEEDDGNKWVSAAWVTNTEFIPPLMDVVGRDGHAIKGAYQTSLVETPKSLKFCNSDTLTHYWDDLHKSLYFNITPIVVENGNTVTFDLVNPQPWIGQTLVYQPIVFKNPTISGGAYGYASAIVSTAGSDPERYVNWNVSPYEVVQDVYQSAIGRIIRAQFENDLNATWTSDKLVANDSDATKTNSGNPSFKETQCYTKTGVPLYTTVGYVFKTEGKANSITVTLTDLQTTSANFLAMPLDGEWKVGGPRKITAPSDGTITAHLVGQRQSYIFFRDNEHAKMIESPYKFTVFNQIEEGRFCYFFYNIATKAELDSIIGTFVWQNESFFYKILPHSSFVGTVYEWAQGKIVRYDRMINNMVEVPKSQFIHPNLRLRNNNDDGKNATTSYIATEDGFEQVEDTLSVPVSGGETIMFRNFNSNYYRAGVYFSFQPD